MAEDPSRLGPNGGGRNALALAEFGVHLLARADIAWRVRRRGTLIEIESEIAGNVWRVEKAKGDRIEEEDVLLILESMKMEIPVEAPCSGTVSEVRVREGDTVEEGTVLVLIEP